MKKRGLGLQRNEILDNILSVLPEHIYIYDKDMRCIYVNRSGAEVLKFEQTDMIGRIWSKLWLPKKITQPFEDNVRKVFSTGDSLTAEINYPSIHGTREHIYTLKPIKDANGHVSLVVNTVRDIAEQKHAEEALKESGLHSRAIFNKAAIGIALLSVEGMGPIIEVNPAFCQMLGYSEEYLLGQVPATITHPEDIEASWQLFKELAEGKRDHYQIEKRYIKRGDKVIWSRLSVSLVRDDAGNPLYAIGIVEDITERKQIEEERERFLYELNSLRQITNVAIGMLSLDELLNSLLARLAKIMAVDTAVILVEEGNQLIIRTGIGIKEQVWNRYAVKVGEGFAGTVAKLTIPLYVEDAQHDPHILCPFIEELGIRSLLGVPLMYGGRIIGVLHVGWLHIRPKNINDIYLLEVTADRCAMAIVNAKLFDKTREVAELSNALNDINAAISSTLDFDEIMQRVVEESAKAIGSETADVMMCEDNHWAARYVYGRREELLGLQLTYDEAKVSALAAKTIEPVAVNDAYSDSRVNTEIMKEFGIRSILTTPLVVKGDTIGTLNFLYFSAPVVFTEAQIDFARKLGASVSLALENARLYEAQRNLATTQ
ncbi:MAG TPA: PAS domain S-box protein [Anaerolineae bacterium]|nr:PAS domain S-box protein [Anaerolineae bacterium]